MWHRQEVMKIHYAPALALLLIAAACGDDPDASGPPVLVVTGSAMNAPSASADMAAGASESKMWAPWRMNFVAGADLPALDSDARSYSISAGSFSVDDVAAIASTFGVTGDVVELDASVGGGWRMGSEDGSTDAFWVFGTMGYWSYMPKWDESMMSRGCAIASSPDGTVSSEPVDCASPQPPANVPSEDEARSLFATMVADMGLDADDMVLESYADEWSASVYGYLKIGGVRSPLSVGVGFGAEGAVTYVNGFLGEVVEGASYPRIGTAAALERLNSESANNAVLRGGVAVDDMVVTSGVALGGSSVDVVAPDTVVPVTSSDVVGAPIDATMPIDATLPTIPTDIPVEVHDVNIVAVEEELVMLYGQDESIYLVPGYAFIAAEDENGYASRYTVSALPDEYVQQADPVAIEPAVAEPAVDPGSEVSISDAAAAELVGLTESGAIETAKANGWESRVVSRDGVDLAVTMDYRMDRVNLTVVDDVVTASKVG